MSFSSALAIAIATFISAVAITQTVISRLPGSSGPVISRSTPGPVVGVGLPIALAGAAFIWVRRRSKDR